MIMMARPSVQVTVNITNHLTEKILIVHCRSKDDDLGAHAVAVGASFHWSFGLEFFGGTRFSCKLAVEDKRISFVAYEQGVDAVGDWFVLDDGVHGNGSPYFLKAAWRRPAHAWIYIQRTSNGMI
ncbi:unnamed protein product [Linum tenue]|uniref:S-protein homolog n=1 Tax=Linum tenue TaxID=586396 RepID=A0AAV0IC09_9ROSI|nr:unnamed protein product [Linum tenue]